MCSFIQIEVPLSLISVLAWSLEIQCFLRVFCVFFACKYEWLQLSFKVEKAFAMFGCIFRNIVADIFNTAVRSGLETSWIFKRVWTELSFLE